MPRDSNGSRVCSVKNRESRKDFRQGGDVFSLAAMQEVDLGERGKTRSCGCSPYSQTHLLFKKFLNFVLGYSWLGFPAGASGKEPAHQCRRPRRHRIDPWVWKIPWRRAWQPTPLFLPGESHGQRSLAF